MSDRRRLGVNFPRFFWVLSLVLGCGSARGVLPTDEAGCTAVKALVAECETQWGEHIESFAEEVVRVGRAILPALREEYRKAMDPHVLVWTRACEIRIEKGWDQDAYERFLREEMGRRLNSPEYPYESWRPYAANLYVMGDDDAYVVLKGDLDRKARQLAFDIPGIAIVSLCGKRPRTPYYIRHLSSRNSTLRSYALRMLWQEFHTDEGYVEARTPEDREAAIRRFEKRWEDVRQKASEDTWRVYVERHRLEFPELRGEFEIEMPCE